MFVYTICDACVISFSMFVSVCPWRVLGEAHCFASNGGGVLERGVYLGMDQGHESRLRWLLKGSMDSPNALGFHARAE